MSNGKFSSGPKYDERAKERMKKYIRIAGDCWEWTGTTVENTKQLGSFYSRFSYKGKTTYGHRVSYMLYKGDIPDGLIIDHLCRNTICVNPDHLEAVTYRVNIQRAPKHIIHGHDRGKGRLRKNNKCNRGHDLSADNIWVSPTGAGPIECKTCNRLNNRKTYLRKHPNAKRKPQDELI